VAERLRSSEPPQFFDLASTAGIMWTSFAVLVPAAAWGVYLFGIRAAIVLLVSVTAALAGEAIGATLLRRRGIGDGSAALTGLLIGMAMPPGVPLFIPVVAALFAMLVVKWSFGGLGANWMHPALAGWLFVSMSWPGEMSRWLAPSTIAMPDGLSGATPLGLAAAAHGSASGPMAALAQSGYPVSVLDTSVTGWLNARLLGPLGIDLPGGYVDLFVGHSAGSIGEASVVLLLLGSVVLYSRRIISWPIPLAYFTGFGLLTYVFGGLPFGQGYFSGDVLFALSTGSLVFSMFFFATDSVTSPPTRAGQLVYGAGLGILMFLLRSYGSFPEASGLAILLMNILVPTINRIAVPRRFGTRPARTRREAA
jgi:electron transport complex protein RnfD